MADNKKIDLSDILPGNPSISIGTESIFNRAWYDYYDPTKPFQDYWNSINEKENEREKPFLITLTFRF